MTLSLLSVLLIVVCGLAFWLGRRSGVSHDREPGASSEPQAAPEPAIPAEDVDQLTAEVARLGGLAEAQVNDALDAVMRRDVDMARGVIERDLRLDALQRDIERKAVSLIERRPADPAELRRPLGAIRMAIELERTGDLAKGIARRALILAEGEPIPRMTRSTERMGRLVTYRLRDVLDAYTASDLERARGVWNADDEVDEHYSALVGELLTYMRDDPRTIDACAHLLFVAKNLERIGDHATNLAEIIHHDITGEPLPAERPRWTPAPTELARTA